MRRLWILAVGGMVLGLIQAPSLKGDDVVQQLTKLKHQWAEAEDNRDTGFLERLLADDFEAGTAKGDVINKEQLIQRIKSPGRRIDEHHSDDIRVRVYGNVAVMTDHTTISGVDNGSRFGGEFRFVRIFVKQHGRWQAVLAQATPMKSDPAISK
jgi:ketosteroid isomerase-like protein